MHTVSVRREITAPLDEVWAALDDFGGVAKYNPNVDSSRIVSGPATGSGATRECVLNDGGRIEEEIVEYESRRGYTVNFTDVGDFPLETNVVDIEVSPKTETRTSVTMTSRFEPKFGPIGWVMAKLMMKAKFLETFEEVLDGLDTYVRSEVESPSVTPGPE